MKKLLLLVVVFFESVFLSSAVFADGFSEPPHPCYESILSPTPVVEKPAVGLIFDEHLSPYVGSEAIQLLLRAYERLDDAFFLNTEGDTQGVMVLGRFTKLVLENALFSTGAVAQHEIFGHGARAREFHLPVYRYVVRPYSGYTSYDGYVFSQLSFSEQIAFAAGGVEGTGILATGIRNRWLQTGCMDEREANLYLLSSLDQTGYVLSTKSKRDFPRGHDILGYIQLVNAWYGEEVLTSSNLRSKVMVDFLDPFLYYSLYSTLGRYVFTGYQIWDFPMIPICEYRYLPGFRLALAPYGPEYLFRNYIIGPRQNYIITFRYGSIGKFNPVGATLEVFPICAADEISIDGRLDLWNQPRLFTQSATNTRTQLGAAFSFFGRYQLTNQFQLWGQLGYKTTGYIPGEFLNHSIIARIGFGVCF